MAASLATHGSRSLGAALLGIISLVACSPDRDLADDESSTADTETDADHTDTDAPTWWRDVEPVVRTACVTCHSPDNIGPFSLETYDEFLALAPILAPAIESGQMPPWPPGDDCNTYANDRSLSDDQQELLLSYMAGDMPEGDPADSPPDGPPAREVVPDAVLEMAEPYTPTSADDYRCFTMPWPEDITEDRFVTALEVYPGERSLVHHVIMFVVEADQADDFLDLDANDPGPGYTCFGGPGTAPGLPPTWLGAWVPGLEAGFAPEGVGLRVTPGSMLIMQVHYHATPGMDLADRSSIGVEMQASVDRPAVILPMTNIAWLAGNGAMHIPAGDPDVTHETTIDNTHPVMANLIANGLGAPADADLEIHDGGLHMHLFGKRGRLQVRDKGGGNEACIVDVPRWDFNWQSSYLLEQPLILSPDRELHLQCWWDNSAENQPFVDGVQLEPSDLDWGDRTLDEMCLGIMYITAAK
ncbi:monooxygenase [Enhygromyxa salina]|uniref:Cytochrome c domain-containing protein n=1 Tax=Enhygromyxa salina TaxID=215803 RepID=A0A2S9YUX0_9BACT|nr:monooxygenase [Enhygromyxa salina]PRQ08901.1 hypothetical protein ENSA7_13910 [Enhygromyxa salina]